MRRVIKQVNNSRHYLAENRPGWLLQFPDAGQSWEADLETTGLIDLLRSKGFVLLRGLKLDLAGFEAFTARFCDRFHAVGTRQPITSGEGDTFSSEVPKSNFSLFAHSEGTYRPFPPPPDVCFFNCVKTPDSNGGETMLVDGIEFLERIPPGLRERFDRGGIIYQACWDTARWQTEFAVSGTDELRSLMAEHPEIKLRFIENAIEVRCKVPAIRQSLGGAPAFANGLLAHLPEIDHQRWNGLNAYSRPTNRVFFGDGEEISPGITNQLIDIQDDIAMNHQWAENDLLVLDNARVMHGRRLSETAGERVIRSRFGRIRRRYDQRQERYAG